MLSIRKLIGRPGKLAMFALAGSASLGLLGCDPAERADDAPLAKPALAKNATLVPSLEFAGMRVADPGDRGDGPSDKTERMTTIAATSWWNSPVTYQYKTIHSWDDTDLGTIATGTEVQLRHRSKLVASTVENWGWQPEFVDQVTGQTFRFLHLRPQNQYAHSVGMVYAAGTIVGLSGGDSCDTGFCDSAGHCNNRDGTVGTCSVPYSTGAHLCVQTPQPYRTAFPTDHSTWSCARSAHGGHQYWTCNTDNNNRYQCDASGRIVSSGCRRGCYSGGIGKDDLCIDDSPLAWSCSKSAYGGKQLWTCSGGKLYRCDGAGPTVVNCPAGCNSSALGLDDTCQ